MKNAGIKALKTSVIMIGLVIAAAIAGLLLLFLVELLPDGIIEKHVNDSAPVFQQEGVYPVVSENYNSQLDNYTDSEMLMISSTHGDFSAFEDALFCYMPTGSSVGTMAMRAEGTLDTELIPYGRYWNGYQVIYRVLLLFMNYSGMRVLNLLLLVAGIALVCYQLWKRNATNAILPYLITILLMIPWVMKDCITFCLCFYVAQIAIQIYLAKYEWFEENNRFIYLCLFTGILTSYFDLLTYPLYTLAMLLCIRFMVKRNTVGKEFIESIGHCIAWCFGYGAFWLMKWVLVTLLTDYNMFAEGFENVAYRTGTEQATAELAIKNNIKAFWGNYFVLAMLVYILVALVLKFVKKQINVRDLVIFGIVFLFPFVWYSVTVQHSWWHAFFACKELAISSMALMCMVTPFKEK